MAINSKIWCLNAYSRTNHFYTVKTKLMSYLLIYFTITGESCTNRREDSLIVLEKNLTMDKGIKYECRDVIADPNDASMARETAEFIAKYIIAPYQTGKCLLVHTSRPQLRSPCTLVSYMYIC